MNERLHERARQTNSRVLVRAWELRQDRHAKGVWYRLRRLLAASERVFVVPDADFDALIASGIVPASVGAELEPARRIVVINRDDLARLPNARELPVKLSAELLTERNWALLPFKTGA